jgi:hypothetical protein
MMEAARTSETSVDNYFTRQYIPEDNSELQKVSSRSLQIYVLKIILTTKELWKNELGIS